MAEGIQKARVSFGFRVSGSNHRMIKAYLFLPLI